MTPTCELLSIISTPGLKAQYCPSPDVLILYMFGNGFSITVALPLIVSLQPVVAFVAIII